MNWSRWVRYAKGRWITARWRLRGVSIEDRVVIAGKAPHLAGKGRYILHSRISFRGFGRRGWFHVRKQAVLTVGDRSFFNSGVVVDVCESVTIGRNCLIGDNVVIQDSNYHEVEEGAGVRIGPVTIGDNVWIARDAIVLPGVTIGDHSVIGAGSVVTRDVPPRSVAAGNPARVLREIDASEEYVRR